MDNETAESLLQSVSQIKGWPLNARDTFAAFLLQGLASRLQPLQVSSVEAQTRVVGLAFEMANMAMAKSKQE